VQSDPGFLDLLNITPQGIKGSLGMWETSLAAPSNETSGVAIRTRERQADTGNYDWGANVAEMAEAMAIATDEILPKVIDVPQQVRIVGEDDKESVIWAASLEEGAQDQGQYFNLNQGKYDLLVKMTQGADTKRDQTNILLQEIFRAVPGSVLPLGPSYIRNSEIKDADGAAKLLERWANTQSPGLFPPEEGQQDPQQMQAALTQMQQQMQQMQEAIQKMGPENQQLKIENASIKADKRIEEERVRIEWFKAKADAGTKGADVSVKRDTVTLKADQQQHDQTMDKVGLQMDARAMQHGQAKDGAEFHLKAKGQAHTEAKDRAGFQQAGEKMHLDHEAKISAQAEKPTGATGNTADAKA
jgi:regulator of replication initiation timing